MDEFLSRAVGWEGLQGGELKRQYGGAIARFQISWNFVICISAEKMGNPPLFQRLLNLHLLRGWHAQPNYI